MSAIDDKARAGQIERVQQRLADLCISARRAARRAGLASEGQIAAWMRGEQQFFRTDTMGKIAAALECDPQWLQYGTGPMQRDRTAPAQSADAMRETLNMITRASSLEEAHAIAKVALLMTRTT